MRSLQDLKSAPAGSRWVTHRTEFFRAEFVKHRRCLEKQKEYYSERAIADVEKALTQIIAKLETLSAAENADEVVSRLLRKFDVVTGLSNWTDPPNLH